MVLWLHTLAAIPVKTPEKVYRYENIKDQNVKIDFIIGCKLWRKLVKIVSKMNILNIRMLSSDNRAIGRLENLLGQ